MEKAEFLPLTGGAFLDSIGPIMARRGADWETCLTLDDQHLNPVGTAHGGLLMTLLETTLRLCASPDPAQLRLGERPAQFNCNICQGAKAGETVEGHARVSHTTKSLLFATGQLLVGGRIVMTGSAIFLNPPRPG